jgi:hypothetical protein
MKRPGGHCGKGGASGFFDQLWIAIYEGQEVYYLAFAVEGDSSVVGFLS